MKILALHITIHSYVFGAINIVDATNKNTIANLRRPPFFKSKSDRQLTHQNEIIEGTTVVDLCDYHPTTGLFDKLPITVTEAEPDVVYAIEEAAGLNFTFDLCGMLSSPSSSINVDSALAIWSGISQGDYNFEVHDDDGCGTYNGAPRLTWTVPDDSTYYVKFTAVNSGSYSAYASWSTDGNWDSCLLYCGPSVLDGLECCDKTTGTVGLACCDTVPYDPSNSACCGDGSIVSGTDSSVCVPSSQPSIAPSSAPTNFPSSQPSAYTCEMSNPCNYDIKENGEGGFDITETYFPVCVMDGSSKKGFHYRQECYPNSTIFGLSDGDVIEGKKKGDVIANCGCCPSKDMLPDGIDKVEGSTSICEGAIDCVAEGFSPSSNAGAKSKDILFETCIDDQLFLKENFYVPPSSHEAVVCGHCIDCTAQLKILTDSLAGEIGWELRLDGTLIDSRNPGTYESTAIYREDLAIPNNCYNDCYEIVITDSFGDGPNGATFDVTFDDENPIPIPFADGGEMGENTISDPIYFGPGCVFGRKLISPTAENASDTTTASEKIFADTKLIAESTVQITVKVPRNQHVKLLMLDSADSSFMKIMYDGYASVDTPVIVTFDLGDIYSSTYEAQIIGEDNMIPLALHRVQVEK